MDDHIRYFSSLEVHARLLARINHTPTPASGLAPRPRPRPTPGLRPTPTPTSTSSLAQQGSSSPGLAPSSKVATLLLQHKFRSVA